MIDTPGPVRKENALDAAALKAFLGQYVPDLSGEASLRQYRGGASNLTYELTVGEKAFIVRCAPDGAKAKGAHDMGREFEIQRLLKPVFPLVPAVVALESTGAVIGKEFYVMEKLEGVILRKNPPEGFSPAPAQTRALCERMLDVLTDLHRLPLDANGLGAFGKGPGYAQRQIEGWWGRYQPVRTWNTPSFKRVHQWLMAHLPENERFCFIHNDYRFDNLVLDPADPSQIRGVLDWEMATVGDPLMDLGNTLAYWVQADDDFFMKAVRRQPTHLPGMMTRREVVDYYCKRMGFDPGKFAFYEVYGLFRLAVIAQQIYFRYHKKQTTNPAFRGFWLIVNYLHWSCVRVMKGS